MLMSCSFSPVDFDKVERSTELFSGVREDIFSPLSRKIGVSLRIMALSHVQLMLRTVSSTITKISNQSEVKLRILFDFIVTLLDTAVNSIESIFI